MINTGKYRKIQEKHRKIRESTRKYRETIVNYGEKIVYCQQVFAYEDISENIGILLL